MNRNNVLAYCGRGFFASITGILVFLLILPTSTPAQEDSTLTQMEQPDFLTSGLYGGGLTFINGDTYVRLQLQPDIPLGKVGIGLDLILLYNPYAEGTEPQILAEDGEAWDNPSHLVKTYPLHSLWSALRSLPFSIWGVGLPNHWARFNYVRLF